MAPRSGELLAGNPRKIRGLASTSKGTFKWLKSIHRLLSCEKTTTIKSSASLRSSLRLRDSSGWHVPPVGTPGISRLQLPRWVNCCFVRAKPRKARDAALDIEAQPTNKKASQKFENVASRTMRGLEIRSEAASSPSSYSHSLFRRLTIAMPTVSSA